MLKYICKPGYNRASCTLMFIATLFIISKLWKQPRCPITDKLIRTCGIYTQYSHKEEIMLFAGKWMELEFIMLSKVNQTQDKGHMFSLICGS
jgi:hypothetical protein